MDPSNSNAFFTAANIYLLLKDFAGPIATAFAAIMVTRLSKRLGESQVEIGRLQTKISDAQSQTAKQQAQTAVEKLRLDLFDHRLEVFKAMQAYISYAAYNADPSDPEFKERQDAAYARIHEITFLFGDEVASKFRVAVNKIPRLRLAQHVVAHGHGERRDEAIEIANNLPEELSQISQQMYEWVHPFMRFEDIAKR